MAMARICSHGWPRIASTAVVESIAVPTLLVIGEKNFASFGDSTRLFLLPKLHQKLSRKLSALREGAMLDKSSSAKSEKREKFVKLAQNRTINAIKAIRVIGKLGNKNAYQFDDSDVQKIVRALSKEVDALKARMSSTGGKELVDFSL